MASAASSARMWAMHVGHLVVGHVVEEPVGDVGVQLLEDVRFELGVAVHLVEDLLPLGVRQASSRRSAICAGFSLRTRRKPDLACMLAACPINGSNAFQSRHGCPPFDRIKPKNRAGRLVSRHDTTQPSPVCCSSMSQARTSSTSVTSMRRWPRMSSRSRTSPSRRSKPLRSTLALAMIHPLRR